MTWSEVALLTPVPYLHLESGVDTCRREGRVAFGSDSAMAMAETAAIADEARVRVLFYASGLPGVGAPMVTWAGTFVRLTTPRLGRHPEHDRLRPPTTDQDGRWQIFYEVSELHRLDADKQLRLADLKKRDGKKLAKPFIPLGPVLIENPI